jgi:hypothetical protein
MSLTIDQLEFFRNGAFALFVLAAIGVTAGVYWENEDFSKSRRHCGWLLLLLSLGAETALTVMIFVFDGKISSLQRTEIISLQQRLLPRSLPIDAQRRIASKVCAFGQFSFNVLPLTYSDLEFIGQLMRAIELCRWEVIGLQNRNEVISSVANSVGIRILFDPNHPEFKGVSEAFAAALIAEGIAATAEAARAEIPITPGMILIVISAKP